jgi:small subunit ribosomal protein S16
MAVKLRLRRGGRKGQPHYRIVAADARSPRDGKFLEQIGTYDPMRDPAAVSVDHEVAMKWLRQGAQPTDTVRSILSKEGIMLKLHLVRKGKTEAEIEAAFEKWKAENERKLSQKANAKASAKANAEAKRLDAEKAKREQIASRIAEKNTPPAAEPAESTEAEAPAAEEAAAPEAEA